MKKELLALADELEEMSRQRSTIDQDRLAEMAEELWKIAMEKWTKMTKQQLKEDVEFLLRRANQQANAIRFNQNRETGASSSSIVSIAYGEIPLEKQELPFDKSDLDACERMWVRLPEHRKQRNAVIALEKARVVLRRR